MMLIFVGDQLTCFWASQLAIVLVVALGMQLGVTPLVNISCLLVDVMYATKS